MITDDDIKRVRDANDIVELIGERVVLKQRGREFWGNCPFHNEKTPSFKVDPASQFYHCFGCGEGGDVFKYVMKTEGLNFLDAVRSLAQRKSIELKDEQGGGAGSGGKRARLIAVCDETNAFYHQQLMRVKSSETDAARQYLGKRGLGGSVARDWKLGFAPGRGMLVRHLQEKGFTDEELVQANVAFSADNGQLRDRFYNRIMFPIYDLQGRTIAFGGRVIGSGEPKYLNSSDTRLFHKRENMFAIDKAKAPITTAGAALVVEGYTDVIAMHQGGFTNTVATLGTALTPEHLKLLSRFTKKVVLLFDGDEAGMRAADRATDLINIAAASDGWSKLDLFVAVLPNKLDPAEYIEAEGKESMQSTLDSAVSLIRFALDRRLAKWDLDQVEQRNRALNDAVTLLAPLKGTLLASDYVNYLADLFGKNYEEVAMMLERAKPQPVQRAVSSASTSQDTNGAATQATSRPVKQSKAKAMEIELLLLFIEHPEVRERVASAFKRIKWSSAEHESIAKMLLGFNSGDVSSDMLAKLTAQNPDISSILSGARLASYDGVPPNRLAGKLMFDIREDQLKTEISDATIQLRRVRSENVGKTAQTSDQAADKIDDLFRRISELQQELAELRRKYNSDNLFS